MDLQICAILSVLETVGLLGTFQISPSPSLAVGSSRNELLKIFAVLFLGQYTLLKIFRIFVQPIFFSPLRHLPTPEGGHFMLGQLLNQYRASRPDALWLEWAARWPDSPFVRYFGFANAELLLVNGVEAHREVLQTHCYDFKKPASFERLVGDIAGAGLLFTEGEEHRKQRKMIMNVFSLANLKRTLPVFMEKADDLAAFLCREIAENPAGTIEMYDAYSKATIDTVGVSSLGIELCNLRSSSLDLDFLQLYEKLLAPSYASALISFINVAVPVRRLLWFVPANREWVEATRELRAMLRRCVQDRIRDVGEKRRGGGGKDEPERRDLLTYMVEEMLAGGQPLTVDLMMEHLLNFLAAGHETVAGTMVWASYVLATKPEIQDRLRADIMDALKENPTPGYAEIERMPYMTNFVKEVIRVYGTALMTQREAARDVVICGTRIPKGATLMLSPHTINTSTRVWGADAAEFVPERWDRSDNVSAYSVMTFLGGPRVCIGRQYALLELKVLLLRLVPEFRFVPADGLGHRGLPLLNPCVVMRPRGGLRLRLERIQRSI